MIRTKHILIALLIMAVVSSPVSAAFIQFTGWEWLTPQPDVTFHIENGNSDDIVYTAGAFTGVRVIDTDDGSVVDSFGNESFGNGFVRDGGYVYGISEDDNAIYEVYRGTNTTTNKWTAAGGEEIKSATVTDGKLYFITADVVSEDGVIYRGFDNGTSKEIYREIDLLFGHITAINDNQFYVSSQQNLGDSSLYRYDLDTDTLTLLESGITPYGGSVERIELTPGGDAIVAADNTAVTVVDKSGNVVQTLTNPNGYKVRIPDYANGFVYARGENTSTATTTYDVYQWDLDNGSLVNVYKPTDEIPIQSYRIRQGNLIVANSTDIGLSGEVDETYVSPTTSNITLEIDAWMGLESSQPYRVYLNETNRTTGKSTITDVTADANVTIYNITNTSGLSGPIATVNNSSDTIESYNQTGVVAVNATWNGETLNQSENLTVGDRNLSNIGIMPPSQYPCSFLGCDEAPDGGDNPHNIGSSMQWLWLIIVVMVAGARFAENPWAGVGAGIMFSILVWVLGYIDLGATLVTVFSGLLIGAAMARTQMGRGVTRDNERSGIQARNRR
jgi:hypothetical protein